MGVRFRAAVAVAAFCGTILAWAAFPPDIVLRIDPHGIVSRGGHAFAWPIVAPGYLPAALLAGDSVSDPNGSRLQVYEQGRPTGPAHAPHQEIEQTGAGRFSHWLSAVFFSASDNTDPRTNGRAYEARVPIAPPLPLVAIAAAAALLLAGAGLVGAARRVSRRAALRALAWTTIAAAAVVVIWAAFPPQQSWRIERKDMVAHGGHSFAWTLPASALAPFATVRGDSLAATTDSRLLLFENGKPLGPPHAVHAHIGDSGGGAYSHWDATIVFSTPDNTDPRTNQRAYEARAPVAPATLLIGAAAAILLGALALGLHRGLRTGAPGRALIAAAMQASAIRLGAGSTVRRTALRALAWAAVAAAAAVLVWLAFPPHGTWRIEPKDIAAQTGRSFTWIFPTSAFAPFVAIRGDSADAGKASRLRLFEDGRQLGPSHIVHALVADIGGGAYSHWDTAVVFSTPDDTDPRTNQRGYEARAPIGPASWLIGIAAAILLGALAFGWRHALRTSAPGRVPRWARIAAAMPAAAFLAAAIMATVSLLDVFHGEREISASEFIPDGPQAFLKPAERVSSIGVYALDFPRLIAPFLEIGCCSNFAIRRGDVSILPDRAFDPRGLDPLALKRAISLRPDNRFYDFDNYLYFHLATPPRWYEIFKVRFPIRADTELIVALWLCAIGAIALYRRSVRFVTDPSPAAVMRGTAIASAVLGAMLLAVNAAGLLIPLRPAEIDNPSPETVRRSYGPGDATMTWEAARAQLATGPAESRTAYAHRLTDVIAQSVMHYWNQSDRRQFRLQIPLWENYLLWLAGELRSEYQLYAFADPYKAIERGVGMCDQVSSALVTLLRREGLDARIVQLNGHTVVTAEVEPNVWHVLDADFNVVIPADMTQIQAEPNMVRPYYQAALNHLDPASERTSLDLIASFFAPPTYVGEAGANSALGERSIAFEALAYWLKWRLPLMLLGFAGVVFGGVWVTGRRATAE